jgi:hypothetical protein
MARETKVIYNQMAEEKATFSELNIYFTDPNDPESTLDNSQNLLNDLTTTSKVGIWRMFLWVVAFGHHILEVLWDKFKLEIQKIIESAQPGTVPWYQKQALAFQYGHNLVWNGSKFVYLVNDPESRIITRCSVTDAGGVVRVKVATGEVDPVPLSSEQQLAFTTYMNQVKFAGTNVLIVNLSADLLKTQMEVIYNPLFISGIVKTNVINAINNYLKSLPFNGVFRLNELKDAIRSVDGVIDVDINYCGINSVITPAFSEVEIDYQTTSGYVRVHSTYSLDGYFDQPTNSILTIKLTSNV